jgi:type VI secretion system secreted protein VgrG
MLISPAENEVVVTGPAIRFVADDGSYIKIGGDVTLGTNGDIKLLSASHKWGGPSTESAPKSAFNNAPTDQRFRLHFDGDTPDAPRPAGNQAYRITTDSGQVLEHVTDANGLTQTVKDEGMKFLKVDILQPEL